MLAILGSALPMAVLFISRGVVDMGIFLLYLVVITGTSIWLARRAIQRQRDLAGYHDRKYVLTGWVNLVAGLLVLAIGLARGSMLLSTFCYVGIAIGIGMLRQARTLPTARNCWLKEHYGAMLGNGVATHVAFLGIGMRSTIASFDRGLAATGAVVLAAGGGAAGGGLSGPELWGAASATGPGNHRLTTEPNLMQCIDLKTFDSIQFSYFTYHPGPIPLLVRCKPTDRIMAPNNLGACNG